MEQAGRDSTLVVGTWLALILAWPPSDRQANSLNTPEALAADIADVGRAAFGSNRCCVRNRPSDGTPPLPRASRALIDGASILDFALDICGISMHVAFIATIATGLTP